MDTSISDSESSKIRTLLIAMAFMRTNTGTPNVQMSPMLPLLLMNSDLNSDNGIVMMALLINQLGNDQTQESFYLPSRNIEKSKEIFREKTLKDEYDAAITNVRSGWDIKGQFAACAYNDNIYSILINFY